MYVTTEDFDTAISDSGRSLSARIKLGDTEIISGIRSIRKCQMSCAGTNFTVGGAIASYVDIELWKPDVTVENKEISVELGIALENETEWVPLGVYVVPKCENDDGLLSFTAYDRIQSKMGGAYFSKITYPADGKQALQEIANMTGVPIDVSDLLSGVIIKKRVVITEQGVDGEGNQITDTTYEEPFNGYSFREALGYIAMLYCRFAVTDRTGKVIFKQYADVDYTVLSNRYYDDLILGETVFAVDAISCSVGEETLTTGDGIPSVQLENPVMTQERLNAILQELSGLQFLPASVSFLGDMRIDVGDTIKVHSKNGSIIRIPIMRVVQEFDGGLLTKIESYGGAKDESTVTGPTIKKIERAYTELFLVKELVGSKANFDYVYGKVGEFEELKVKQGTFENATIQHLQSTDAQIQELSVKSITTDNLNAKVAELGYLSSSSADLKYAEIGSLNATDAKIDTLAAKAITTDNLSVKVADLGYATITSLDAATARIGVLETDTLKIQNLDAETARLGYAKIDQLNAVNAQVQTIQGDLADYKTVVAGELIAAKGWMAEGSIGSAQISDLDVNKLNAGTIDTAKIGLESSDSSLQITGSQILVNDTTDAMNPMNRVIVGKYTDASGNPEYGLLVRSADGQTVMIDGDGVHNAGITDGAIDNNKVADNANISGKKLDIQSVVTEINEGETKISQTIIQVGEKSLDIVLKEQTQKITDTEEKIQNIEAKKMYRIETVVSGRQIFQDKEQSATICCHVYSWDDDITASIDDSLFYWHRESGNEAADADWDAYHVGTKTVTISTEDVMENASFYCEVKLEE